MVTRQVAQQGNRWVIDYKVRNQGPGPLVLAPGQVQVQYEATVSNSRCRPHAIPRQIRTEFSLAGGPRAAAVVMSGTKPAEQCREWVALALEGMPTADGQSSHIPVSFRPITIEHGHLFDVRLTLEHDHFLHGTYDPLLGPRRVRISFGPASFYDQIVLASEYSPALPPVRLNQPAKERLDTSQFHSPPDSLYLAADVPGYQYFRFDDVPVRYGTTFRLCFWYLLAPGTDGKSHVRIMEYQDTPSAWFRLEDGGFDEVLPVQGRWCRFERVFRTLEQTTTIALDFRITGAELGELWIDDIELVPLYLKRARP